MNATHFHDLISAFPFTPTFSTRFFCPSTLTLYEGASQYNISCSIKSNPQISSSEIALLLETFPSVGAAAAEESGAAVGGGGGGLGGRPMSATEAATAVVGAAATTSKNKSTSTGVGYDGENGRRLQRLKINAKSG